MLRKIATELCVAAVLCAALVAPAGRLLGQKPDGQAIFTSDTRLVVLHATVIDKGGRFLTTLPQAAFQVYENGVQQQVKLFRREDIPVSMGLIIDNSGSMRDKRSKVAAAALALVKASNSDDEVFVVNFNDDPYLDCEFTNNTKKMEEALTRIDSRGGTAMRDAIRTSIDHMKEKAKKDKKVMLVVTDGNDNASTIGLENLVKAAQQSEVILYAIGLLTEEEKREAKRAKRALDALTESTGGQAFYPKELADVDRIAHQVAHDVRNQYTIAYSPSNLSLDGTFRQIRVVANAPNRPVVRTRTGYYATPEVGNSKSGGSAAK